MPPVDAPNSQSKPVPVVPVPVVVAMLKAPRAGMVKTRLAHSLGAPAATAIYRQLVEHQLRELPPTWPLEIHFAPAEAAADMRAWLGSRPHYEAQQGDDLGARLLAATASAFGRGARRVIVIGGDCPGLTRDLLEAAAAAAASADVVLGPAADGGYYLIGLRGPQPMLFTDIPWSTPDVFAITCQRVRAAGLALATLPVREDVDDLATWQRQAHLLDPAIARPTSANSR